MRNRSRCGVVIVGMALQSLAFVYGALPAWAQAPPPASELQRPALPDRLSRTVQRGLVGPEGGGSERDG